MKSIYLVVALLLSIIYASGQTYISGGIYTNTTWSVSNHPYIVTADLTLFPNDTLIIEPGVEVRFDDGVWFELRGALIVRGNSTQKVTFTANSSTPEQGSWSGVRVKETLGGFINIQHAIFKYADRAIETSFGNQFSEVSSISNVAFESNHIGYYGYTFSDFLMDSCTFSYNEFGISDATHLNMSNSLFTHNDYGLFNVDDIDISFCTFCGNGVAMRGRKGNLLNCKIMNNDVGVYCMDYGFDRFSDNVIAYNNTGIYLSSGGLDSNNVICKNKDYDIVNLVSNNISIPGNCFCETDSSNIRPNIKDGYVDASLGLIDFMPVQICDTTSIPAGLIGECYSQVVLGVDKHLRESAPLTFNLFPNPASEVLYFNSDENFKPGDQLLIFGSNGNQIQKLNLPLGISTINIQLSDFTDGLYMFVLLNDEAPISSGKFMVQKH